MRIPRKIKKWAKKNGWTPHFSSYGRLYFTRAVAAVDLETAEIHFLFY